MTTQKERTCRKVQDLREALNAGVPLKETIDFEDEEFYGVYGEFGQNNDGGTQIDLKSSMCGRKEISDCIEKKR